MHDSSLAAPDTFAAHVPVRLEVPEPMRDAVAEVLAGEYESGYFGEGLRILDLGANVGSFSLWAHLRWPRSTIDAYEPHPGTFQYLRRNLAGFPNISLHNSAVFPTDQARLPFFTRYDGDGESGLADCMERTFEQAAPSFTVDVRHPATLAAADVVKLDVEGAEAEILRHLPLDGVGLILLEYQNDSSRIVIKQLLASQFTLEFEDEFPWDELLNEPGYRRELAGDHWGRMFFASRAPHRLRREAAPHRWAPPQPAGDKSWRNRLRRWAQQTGQRIHR
jgi:FkbM family methyltransferase